MSVLDLSSGLAAEREDVVSTVPSEPFWTENLLFALYDPDTDLGFWLHLGTVPNDWTLWEERVLVMLPGDQGLLTMWSFHRTAQERRPAASNLEFRCLEPWRRWHLGFDGFAVHTSNEEMAAGSSPPGERHRLVIDIEAIGATQVWDAETAASNAKGSGSMASQGWAKEHYEQMFRATGTVQVGEHVHAFHGTGWRDHSRGPRGGGTGDPWGGHLIMGGLFPSGRAFILSRYWTPDGRVTLEGACVVDGDGQFHYAQVETAPRLENFQLAGEILPVGLTWDGGDLDLACTTDRSLWTPMRKKYTAAVDMSGPALNYALNFSRCNWEGEEAYVYSERSDMLNALAPAAWYADE